MKANLCGCCTMNKECDGLKAASKELWRLRLNWFFIMTTSSLFAISYTSISASFHQFVTNPLPNTLQNITKIEPGLGESDALYSWMIMAFNFGGFVGALGAGFLIKFLPYWHLMLAGLLLHTFGYILYAVATHGWLILVSKLLSGLFIGMEMTIALAYFAENSVNYQAALNEMGKDKRTISGLRGKLFALDNIAVNIGYLLGPGVASVFAQFNIDQFRSIAWYNAAIGVALIALQFAIFHGESNCKKFPQRCKLCTEIMKKRKINTINIIITFLVIARGVLSFRFGVYETLYNPVLSDTFGFTEKESSYFFLGLVTAQIAGTLILLILQQVRLDNRIIAILGLVMTIVATALIADWQSIPYDPCTELSPFHHHEIGNHTTVLQSSVLSIPQKRADVNCLKVNMNQTTVSVLESITIDVRIQLQFSNFETHLTNTITSHCQRVHSCPECTENSDDHLCLQYTVVWGSCLIPTMRLSEQNVSNLTAYSCNSAGSALPVCILLDNINAMTDSEENSNNGDQFLDGLLTSNLLDVVHHQELKLIEDSSYNVAMNRCEAMSTSQYHCHWLPDSLVFGHRCHDCPPICRSIHQTLNFVQFTIGAALLMVSLPIAWVPMAAMVSYRVPKAAQGMLMGVIVALSAIGRSVSPLWLDAAYEGFQKRTFIPMIILISTHLPLLAGVTVLYQRLGRKCDDGEGDGTKTSTKYSSTDSDNSTDSNDSEFEKSINESSHLMPTEESKL